MSDRTTDADRIADLTAALARLSIENGRLRAEHMRRCTELRVDRERMAGELEAARTGRSRRFEPSDIPMPQRIYGESVTFVRNPALPGAALCQFTAAVEGWARGEARS